MIFTRDLLLFFQVYFYLFCLQLIALPLVLLLAKKFKYLGDGLWAFARLISLTILALLIWFLAHFGLAVNSYFWIKIIFALLLLLSSIYLFWQQRTALKAYWQRYRRLILIEEGVFLFFLLFLLAIRSFQPEVLGLEKFMDAGFIQVYLKSPTLPATDMWFANQPLNYYSFGHFYAAVLTQVWGLDLAFAYNFLLATIMALLGIEIFSLAFNLRLNLQLKNQKTNFKAAVWAGFLAVFLLLLGGNGQPLWYFLKNQSFAGYWYPDATRFIERSIHEFVAYSFVVADLHAHVLSLPYIVAVLLGIFVWLKELIDEVLRQRVLTVFKENFFQVSLVLGVLFGVLAMTNTWDLLVYGVFLLLIGVLLLFWRWAFFWPLVISALTILFLALLTVAPWYLNFQSIAEGLALTTEKSPLWQLLVLWGPHLLWASALCSLLIKRRRDLKKNARATYYFLVAALALVLFLLLFPEFLYFKDIYQGHQRANTMFKLTFQAFNVLSVLVALFFASFSDLKSERGGFFAWRLFDLRSVFKPKRRAFFKFKIYLRRCLLLYLPMLLFFLGSLSYSWQAYRSYYGFRHYQGLDALAWMQKKHAFAYQTVAYLKKHEPKQVNIIEASGESYSEYSLVSAFSGMPTILGWQVHEWLWRGAWNPVSERLGELKQLYEQPTSQKSQEILAKYQPKYLLLSKQERLAYPKLDQAGFLSLGEIVLESDQEFLLQLKSDSDSLF